MELSYEVVDVFTDSAFGGNPLAVVFGAERLASSAMQQIAAEFNYSETAFVLPADDPGRHTARVRIFTPSRELPFAGHPTVGTATVLAWRGEAFGRDVGRQLTFEQQAGLVPVSVICDGGGHPRGATLTAPEPFTTLGTLTPAAAAALVSSLEDADVCLRHHPPTLASTGSPFAVVELASMDALARCGAAAVDAAAFEASRCRAALFYVRRGHTAAGGAGAGAGDGEGGIEGSVHIRCRMLTAGRTEDPATGSANCALAGLLASLALPQGGGGAAGDGRGAASVLRLVVEQGEEVGRPSLLLAEAEHDHSGVVGAVRIGGHCVATMRGVLLVPFLRSAAGSQPADPAGRGSAGVDARRQEYPAVAPPPVIQEGQPISIR
eukprot:COSAG01_NODE_5824_length_4010_cov_4.300690_1_plen_379_part_00